MKTQTVKLCELVFDEKLLALRPVNEVFVSRYRQHYRTRANMPPITVEEKTHRITSGNHRARAMLAEFGPDHKVKVYIKKYTSIKELLMDFVKENASHGNPLDGISRARLAIALSREGATPEEIAGVMNVPVKKVEQISGRTMAVIGDGKTEYMPVKKGFTATGPITKAQYDEHRRKDLGMSPGQLIDQLLRWLKNDWVEPSETNVYGLSELKKEIGQFLKEHQK